MNNKRQQKRVWHRFVSILSCVVVFCTTYALILPAVTMERDDIVYYCGKEEHEHTDECYESQDEPQCGLEETEAVEGHTHTDDCYEVETVLTCDQDHEHTDECFEEQKKLVCEKEEKEAVEGHTHSEKCFWTTELVCGKEAHTHTRQCESNKDDKETKEEWEHSIPAKLEEKTADCVAQIAKSQKDYKEVKDNFEIDEDGAEHYYTRYGDWYGKPYEDWNVMFTSFVLKYAGIKNEQIPYGHDWNEWIKDLTEKKLFASEDYEPKNGDLIFIKDQKDENIPDKEIKNYVGIITDLEYKKVIVGNLNGQVKEITLDEKDYETNAYVEIKNETEEQKTVEDDETNNVEEEQKPVDEEEEQPKDDENKEEKEDKPVIDYQLPEQFNIETEDFTLVLKPRVFDDEKEEEQPKEEEETSEPVEEDEKQGLHIKQYSLLEQENVQDKIDEENERTKEELDQIAQDNEKQQEEQREKPVPTVKLEKIEEQTTEEDQEEIEQLKEQVDEENLLDLSFYKLRFFVGDQEIDLGDQKFDAELTPTKKFVDNCDVDQEFPDAAPEAEVGYYLQVVQPGTEVPANLVEGTNTTKEETNPEEEVQQPEQATIQTMSMPMATVQTNDSLLINDTYDGESIRTVLKANQRFAEAVIQTPNPNFTVQTYGYIEKHVETNDKSQLPLVDMSKGIPEKYAHQSTVVKWYELDSQGILKSEVPKDEKGQKIPTILFKEKGYEYHKAPNLQYFNILRDNGSYTLKEIWVLKEGKIAKKDLDKREDNWNIYDVETQSIHFTNNASYQPPIGSNYTYVTIKQGTVIRLIYTEKSKNEKSSAAHFYDYDITNGNRNNIAMNSRNDNPERNYVTFVNGQSQGINKNVVSGNYQQIVFGNNATNAGYAAKYDDAKYLDQTINVAQAVYETRGNQKYRLGGAPIFGMLSSFTKTGTGNYQLTFNSGIHAPDLFTQQTGQGRLANYEGKLTFSRKGDLHKLLSADGEELNKCNNLNVFYSKTGWVGEEDSKKGIIGTTFWQNSFWPLDTQDIKGQTGMAPTKATHTVTKNNASGFPVSDNQQNHNSFFGMAYEVNYNIPEDYEGPLEYFFNGDDDMWVFIDGILVCDLGGIHQTRGGYVDIREFCKTTNQPGPTSEGSHTMTVFYLERGQSGSTCYLEYRLPSVTSDEIIQNTGHLEIKKFTNDSDEQKEYEFNIKLYGTDGEFLPDDYAYSKYDANGVETQKDIILKNGDTIIKLKKNERAEIKYLPPGTKYTITEIIRKEDENEYEVYTGPTESTLTHIEGEVDADEDKKYSISTISQYDENGKKLPNPFDEKNIVVNETQHVYFRNSKYYQLPETGSPGIDPPLIAGGASVMTTSFYALALQRKGRWKKRKK
ncbi:fibro-slime domain-containing protein [uncultured Dubosiella sp.]|uniref:DUF7601 domain-containing protein n=1 Tax=uncultured Dubosiella sp. TaxID=1937011 RepID=UPI0025B43F01|nr:fibro-slime domain-containing protein [uncultured Dubosiella sp.]